MEAGEAHRSHFFCMVNQEAKRKEVEHTIYYVLLPYLFHLAFVSENGSCWFVVLLMCTLGSIHSGLPWELFSLDAVWKHFLYYMGRHPIQIMVLLLPPLVDLEKQYCKLSLDTIKKSLHIQMCSP